MKAQTIFRFALLGALLTSATSAAVPALAQKEDRNGRSGTAKEDRNGSQNKHKESRGGSGTNKSDGRNEGSNKGRRR